MKLSAETGLSPSPCKFWSKALPIHCFHSLTIIRRKVLQTIKKGTKINIYVNSLYEFKTMKAQNLQMLRSTLLI
jgi:hypothetical protein